MNYDERIDQALEGLLSEAEWETLQADLIEDPDLRTTYVEQRWLHAQLKLDHETLASLAADETADHLVKRWPGWAAAAGIALLALATFFFAPSENPETVAVLIEANDCRWQGSELPTNEGAKLGTGTLALAEGMATIQFDSGATVTLEAPTVLQVESAMRCRLIEGSVVADVPESAHGFTIDTEKLEVIDLGTRFGVTSTPVGGSHVFVFEGEVKVREDDADEAEHLLSGKSLHFGITPEGPDGEVTRSHPLPSPHSADWTPLSTAAGRGKDAYIRREDGSGMTGSDPLLMVKHTDLAPGNERRAILTFDLATLDLSEVSSTKLALKIESSGLGFSSLVPDSSFAVYGVLDPAIHKWSETDILWENSSELTEPLLDEKQFSRLATFEIGKGASNTLLEVESEALTDYLLSQKQSLATLILVRETGEMDKQGLVHAFASREHPSSPAPTLWFQSPQKQ